MADPVTTIFISYAHADSPFVDRLEADLEQQGFVVWVDRRGLAGGQKWRRELQEAVDRSQVLLMVLSPEAVASEYVQNEYGYASEEGKVIIPLYYRPCKVPLELRGIQWIDFQHSYEQGLQALLHALYSQQEPAALAVEETASRPGQVEHAAFNNLPTELTPLIGREHESHMASALLRQPKVRLLTLTGTGGIGKTRLALQIATDLLADFADGIALVGLAPLTDPTLVLLTIAQTFSLRERSDQPLLEQLKNYLREKQLLLVLDNFEQVVAAAPLLPQLLETCPRLTMLVTSRAVLNVRGEHTFPVPPLTVPDLAQLPEVEELSHSPSVALFLERASAVKPHFEMTQANAASIAELCAQLEGLPLAIELAAARIKLFSPQALLTRLPQRLQLLSGGGRDLPARQQTLSNTIKWSYDLLGEEEQAVFRLLSVFMGGCTLEAVEAVCQEIGKVNIDVVNAVSTLLDNSLLQQSEQEGEEPRLTMLETVREYGLECLRESGEASMCQRAHALYYLALAEEAEPQLKGVQQMQWWRRLEREQENLRAALAWLIGEQEGELALRLGGALWWFWNIRGYWSEGWHWLEAILGLPQAQGRTAWRAKALFGADTFDLRLGHPLAPSLLEESVAIYRELGEKQALAEVLSWLGLGWTYQSNLAAAHLPLEESVVLAREVGDPWILAKTLRSLGSFMKEHGDFKSAHHFLEESVTLYREVKDQRELSFSLRLLSEVAMLEGNRTQATALAEESLALARELEGVPDMIRSLNWLAGTQARQGDAERAVVLLEESLALARDLGDKVQIASSLLMLGGIVLYQGDLPRAEICAQESLMLFRELRTKSEMAMALCLLGEVRLLQGDFRQARATCTEAVLLAGRSASSYNIGYSLIGLAKVMATEGEAEQAALLFGAAASWLDPKVDLDPLERADYEQVLGRARAQLGEQAFSAAWQEGRTMPLEQVIKEVLKMRDEAGK